MSRYFTLVRSCFKCLRPIVFVDRFIFDNRSYDNKGYNNTKSYDNDRGNFNSNRYNSDRNSDRNGYGNNNNWRTENQRGYYRPRQCKLCSSTYHWAGQCDQYRTPEEKCAKLRDQGDCDKCSWRADQGHACRLSFNCRKCNKGIHLEWLCTNQSSQSGNTN